MVGFRGDGPSFQKAAMTHPVQATSDPYKSSLTLGEYRVGIAFNPSRDPNVDRLKRLAADFIDECAEFAAHFDASHRDSNEVFRLLDLAQTHAEDAAMWAVKAVTKPAR